MNIGARLTVRKSKGLSQRELAKRVAYQCTISLIEQQGQPIGEFAEEVLAAPISLADFFTLDLDAGLPDNPSMAPTNCRTWAATIFRFPDRPAPTARQMCILREVMPPGTDTGTPC